MFSMLHTCVEKDQGDWARFGVWFVKIDTLVQVSRP